MVSGSVKFLGVFSVIVGCFLFAFSALAMTSTNFNVSWDSINSGGTDDGTSTNYLLRDTLGEQGSGFSSSSNYALSAGYRTGDKSDNFITFDISGYDNASKVAYSTFSTSTNSVTVASVASYGVDDYIVVIENLGFSEMVSIGKITGINGFVMTVDVWDGSTSTMSAIPVGGNDFVYKLSTNTVAFGTLSQSIENTASSMTRVRSNAANGYTVYVNDDGHLRIDATNFIDDVADNSVTLGQEEYGWKVFGSRATSTVLDYPFSTSTRAIQEAATGTSAEERVVMVYKVSITSGTVGGTYGHTVYFTATANY